MNGLTMRQASILRFIISYREQNLAAPTIREICEDQGIRSPNGVAQHLHQMVRKGYLRRRPGRSSRGYVPTKGRFVWIEDDGMRSITVTMVGGPLDGATRQEDVPDHWELLRIEHRQHGELHVYRGPIDPQSDTIKLLYRGTE